MKKRRYSINEIVSISALVGLFLFMLFAAVGTKNATTAGETTTSPEQVYDMVDFVEATVEFVPEMNRGPSDIYIKFEGLDGEVLDENHRQWCEVITLDQAHSMSVSSSGLLRQKVSPIFEDIRIVKTIDKVSPKLAEAVCKGTVYPTVEIHVTAQAYGTSRVTYLAYELKNVLVTSYAVRVASQSDDVPDEEVTLNFEQIKVTYTEFDSTGKTKGNVEYTWEIEQFQN
jgi:type VI secretion system secreted protein Hcp